MSIIGTILNDKRSDVIGGGNPQTPQYWISKLFGGAPAGKIDESTALTISAVWNAVTIIAGAVGFLPMIVYKRMDRGRERADKHPIYNLIHDRPNPYMDAMTFRETLQGHVLTWGNAYAEIERDGAARPIALWPLSPANVTPQVHDKGTKVRYEYIKNGQPKHIAYENMIHIKGLGNEGLKGYSVIGHARQSLGLAKTVEDYGSRFFKNDATPPTVLEHPATLSDTAEKHLRESWEKQHKGIENAGKMAILEEGMKVHQIGIPPEDAQYLTTREFSVIEIARWFDIPPHMLKDLKRATFSNIEHQGIEFVVWTLTKWLRRWEFEFNYKLLGRDSRRTHFAEFQVNALLRGDIKSRFDAYRIGIYSGWINRNEVRGFENMNPEDGLDDFLQPLNYKVVGEETPVPGAARSVPGRTIPALPSPNDDDSFRDLFDSTWRRIVTKEVNALSRILKKDGDLEPQIREFYEKHKTHVRDVLDPVLKVFGADDRAIVDEADKYIEDSQADLLAAMRKEEGADLLKDWKENKASRMAEEIVSRGRV